MNDTSTTLQALLQEHESSAASAQSLRESLGVLVLSSDILRRHGPALPATERIAQREMMHEAGASIAAALASMASATAIEELPTKVG